MTIPKTEHSPKEATEPESIDSAAEEPGARGAAPSSTRGGGRALVSPRLAAALGLLVGGAGVYIAIAIAGGRAHQPGPPAPSPPARHASEPGSPRVGAMTAKPAAKKPVYRCPMHPAITSDHPGTCPICGMTLVLEAAPSESDDTSGGGASAEAAGPPSPGSTEAATEAGGRAPHPGPRPGPVDGLATVSIDPSRQQLIGLRTVRAERAAMGATWRTVGRVEVDPTRVRRVNVKVESYVDRVFVDFVGKPVRKGQPLIAVYSPSLLAAQEEYLLALRTRGQLGDAGLLGSAGTDLVAAARRKLELWDVPAETLARLAQTGVATKTLTLVSPISGVVTAKNVVEGATLRPGDTPYEITDLRMVWVMADAYESDIPRVRVGMPATLSLPAYPNRLFEGRVEFIDPVVDAASRTAKVHLHFANPKGTLKPEMFGEVTFRGATRTALRIPADALVHTGNKDVVFVALGGGRFTPREVHLGPSDGDFFAVDSGLDAGDEVVTRANFLIDSESRLRASLAALAGK